MTLFDEFLFEISRNMFSKHPAIHLFLYQQKATSHVNLKTNEQLYLRCHLLMSSRICFYINKKPPHVFISKQTNNYICHITRWWVLERNISSQEVKIDSFIALDTSTCATLPTREIIIAIIATSQTPSRIAIDIFTWIDFRGTSALK